MKKLLIFTPRISGQRAHYYNVLSDLCDLTVISELDTLDELLDDYDVLDKKFKHIVIGGIKFRVNSYEALCLNYKKYFKPKEYDSIIIEQVFTPTAFFIMRYLKRLKIKFFASADGGIVSYNENKIKYSIKKYFISLPNYWLTSGKGGFKYLNNYGVNNRNIYKFIFSPYCEKDLPSAIINEEEKKSIKKRLGIEEEIVLFTAGQPIYRKGHDLLIKTTMSFDKSIGIYIAGGGPNELCINILKSQGKMNDNSNVHFLGLLNKERLKEYYSITDIFVFPSRYDIWGYPIQEAMSFGIPIISSDATIAALELIEDGVNGFKFKNESIDDLKEKLEILLNDDNLRKEIANNNFNKSKLYTSENMAKSIYDIICSVE